MLVNINHWLASEGPGNISNSNFLLVFNFSVKICICVKKGQTDVKVVATSYVRAQCIKEVFVSFKVETFL